MTSSPRRNPAQVGPCQDASSPGDSASGLDPKFGEVLANGRRICDVRMQTRVRRGRFCNPASHMRRGIANDGVGGGGLQLASGRAHLDTAFTWNGVATSSSPWVRLWERATWTSLPRLGVELDLERGGDVLIAVGGLGEGDEDVAAPAWGLELDLEATSSSPWVRLWERATRTSPPRLGVWNWIWNGEATSSSPWVGFWDRATWTSLPRLGVWNWIWNGEAMSSSPWVGFWDGATRTLPPRLGVWNWIWNGEATSSSPFRRLSQGDVDVASPKPWGRDQWWGFRSPALMGTGSQFWRGGTGQVAKAVKAQGGL